jgi:hypothetical protein
MLKIDTISDEDAIEQLDDAYLIFECLLDHVARNHPQVLTPDFPAEVEQMLHETWVKYGLPDAKS